MATDGRERGPVTTTLSVAALPNSTFTFHSLQNKLGCVSSHSKMVKWRKEAITTREESGPFCSLIPSAFVSVAVDNINLRAGHSLSIHGQSYLGFDGLATQALNSNVSFDVKAYLKNAPSADLLPLYPEFPSREEYVAQNFPTATQDRDVVGFQYLCLGVAVSMRRRIATRDGREQLSFRRAILDSLKGRTAGRSRIEYVDIRKCNANDIFEIEKVVEMVDPHSAEVTMVAMVGDQPVFKMLFHIWLSSYLKRTRRCHWMIPIAGQFHVDKQGLIPTVKKVLSGGCLEELLGFTGLSDKHQIQFMTLAHYRKNRRVLSQMTAALILRLHKALSELNPDFGNELAGMLREIDSYNSLHPSEKERAASQGAFASKVKEILPDGCGLHVSRTLHPFTLRIGKMMSEAILKISERSINMKFFGQTQLLSVLIPWNAYNILIRKGQTHIVEKFYDIFVRFLHGTIKLNYQENVLFYNFLRRVMPPAAKHIVFGLGHLVANLNDKASDTNLALDETMESGMIRDTKMWNTNNPKLLEASPAFTTVVRKIINSTQNELRTSFVKETIKKDVGESGKVGSICQAMSANKRLKRVDRERKTSLNVWKMLEFLERKAYYGENHVGSAYIVNPLPEPPRIIYTPGFAEQLLGADTQGRFAAALHLGAKLHEVFVNCPLTDEDRRKHFDSKPFHQILNHWNRKWAFKSIAQADPLTRMEQVVERKNKEAISRLIRSMSRRRERVASVKARLLDLYRECTYSLGTHGTRMEHLHKLHEELMRNEHVLSPKAFAFRRNVISNEPFHCASLNFYEELQDFESISESNLKVMRTSSIIPENVASSLSALHIDVTSSVSHNPPTSSINHTIREAVFEKARVFVSLFVSSRQYSNVHDIHFHIDTQGNIPLGYDSVRTPRNRTVLGRYEEEEVEGDLASGGDMFILMSSLFNKSWPTLLEFAENRAFLFGVHTVECARVSVMMKNSEDEQIRDSSGHRREYAAFIHGVPVIMSGLGRTAALSCLKFERRLREDHVLVTRTPTSLNAHERPYQAPPGSSFESALEERNNRYLLERNGLEQPSGGGDDLVYYDATCCWKLSLSGMERYPAGDSSHALSVTRIPFIIQKVSVERFVTRRQYCPSPESVAFSREGQLHETEAQNVPLGSAASISGAELVNARAPSRIEQNSTLTVCVRNAIPELPLLLLLSGVSSEVSAIYITEECLIDVKMLSDALRVAGLDVKDMAMLFCLSGSDHTPHTKSVGYSSFLESYRELRTCGAIHTGHLYTPQSFAEMIDSLLQVSTWVDCEKVFAGAFLKSFNKRKRSLVGLSAHAVGSFASSSSFIHESICQNNNSWAHRIRNLISKQELESPAMYMPEASDFELQFRRSAYWNFIWLQCSQEFVKEPEGVSPLNFGYDENGVVLFEDEQDSKRREKLLQEPVVRTCKCKSATKACSTKLCGCVSRGLSCIFCECTSSCVNKGIKAAHLNASRDSVMPERVENAQLHLNQMQSTERSASSVPIQTEGHLPEHHHGTRRSIVLNQIEDNLEVDPAALRPSQDEIASLDHIQQVLGSNESSDDEGCGFVSDEEVEGDE